MTFSITRHMNLGAVLEELVPEEHYHTLMALPPYEYEAGVDYGEDIIVYPISMWEMVECIKYLSDRIPTMDMRAATRAIHQDTQEWGNSRDAQEQAEWRADEICREYAAN